MRMHSDIIAFIYTIFISISGRSFSFLVDSVFLLLVYFFLHLKFEKLFVCICRPVVWQKRVTASQPPIISQFVLDLMLKKKKEEIVPSLIPYTIVSTKSSLILVHCLPLWYSSIRLASTSFLLLYFFNFCKKEHTMISFDYTRLRIHGSLAHKVMIQLKLLHSIFLVLAFTFFIQRCVSTSN